MPYLLSKVLKSRQIEVFRQSLTEIKGFMTNTAKYRFLKKS